MADIPRLRSISMKLQRTLKRKSEVVPNVHTIRPLEIVPLNVPTLHTRPSKTPTTSPTLNQIPNPALPNILPTQPPWPPKYHHHLIATTARAAPRPPTPTPATMTMMFLMMLPMRRTPTTAGIQAPDRRRTGPVRPTMMPGAPTMGRAIRHRVVGVFVFLLILLPTDTIDPVSLNPSGEAGGGVYVLIVPILQGICADGAGNHPSDGP